MSSLVHAFSRRGFLHLSAPAMLGVAGSANLAWSGEVGAPQQPPDDRRVDLPAIAAASEQQQETGPLPWTPDQRVGFAVVGLGHLTYEQLLPAFGQCRKARLVALVSGSPEKARMTAAAHGIAAEHIYDYAGFDRIREDRAIEAVYIVLPNSQHAEYTVRAAAAGKHVLCEKPMATSVTDCERMIEACSRAGRKLMIGYRIQYEPHNRYIRDLIHSGRHGQVRAIESVNVQAEGDPTQWRLKRALAGGGPLVDVGIYCLNTTRFLTGEEPIEVSAFLQTRPDDPRFREVEAAVTFQMRFPSGILSTNLTSYDTHKSQRYRVHATDGWFGLDPAYPYDGIQIERSFAEGKVEYHEAPRIPSRNQFALEIDHFADCIRHDRVPFTPGEEGLQDQRIMDAIYESARSGRPVQLPPAPRRDAFRGPDLLGS
jgi:predicted dehydrogenase